MLLLGLDTATPAVTVALHDGTRVLAQATSVDKHRHAELLAPATERVLAEAVARREVLLPPVPLYLRRPDAREPAGPKRVTEPARPGRARS